MSYINTVTIMSNLTRTYIEENTSTVYETIYSKIASVTGWETSASGLLVGTGSKQLRINISYLSTYFNYTIYSQNNNGNVYITRTLINTSIETSSKSLYLHYCKSKSGKTIGIGLSTSTTPIIDFIIAEDANGDFSAIGLCADTNSSNNIYYGAQMVWNGYKCKLSGTKMGNHNEYALQPVIDPSLSTSVCKMPNFLSGCMFKELFMILSLPIQLTALNSVVLDIEGKKYQGCYTYPLTTETPEIYNALAILAG